jgi:YHS domain-containing protein
MIKFIILFGLCYLAYRALKSWMFRNQSSRGDLSQQPAAQIDDIMVKDPVCEAYFAKKDGFAYKHGGENLYFCSSECRDKFKAEQSEKESKRR